MCTFGGRQCQTVLILGLRILVHPNQTLAFPLNDIAIKVAKCAQKFEMTKKYRVEFRAVTGAEKRHRLLAL